MLEHYRIGVHDRSQMVIREGQLAIRQFAMRNLRFPDDLTTVSARLRVRVLPEDSNQLGCKSVLTIRHTKSPI